MKTLILVFVSFFLLLSCNEDNNPVTPTKGNIFITSSPSGAQIWMQGVNTSQITPDTLLNLTPGSYLITLKFQNYQDTSFTISVTEGQTTSKSVTLIQIVNSGRINLTFPKGGEELILSEIPVTIEWSSNNVQKVNLFYSTFKDTSWILIADSINSEQGSYNWELPYIISDNYNLKITDCDNDNVFDITDNPFSIIVEQNIIEVIKYYPLNIGNKWVYKVRFRQTVFPPLIDTTYFFKREVIADTTTGDGKVYYKIEEIVYYNNNIKTYYENIDLKTGNIYRRYINNEFEEVLIDSLLAKVGDQFISHRFTNQNSNYYMYTEFLSTEFVEYFGTVRITKKFRELDTFAFYDYYLVENIGLGNYYQMLDVASLQGNLVGCFIEGIVYGDTTITY